MKREVKQKLLHLIQEGNIDKAIEILLSLDLSADEKNQAQSISFRFRQLKRKERKGTISFEQLKTAENQIAHSLIELINNDKSKNFQKLPQQTKSSKKQSLIYPIIIVGCIALLTMLYFFFQKEEKINVGIAINTHTEQEKVFFDWLKNEFEKKCKCDLEYDRKLTAIDRYSSKTRIAKFATSNHIDVIFGGSIGIHLDKSNSKYFGQITELLPFVKEKGIVYDKYEKWIGLYKKIQGIAWIKDSLPNWSPKSLDDIENLVSKSEHALLIPKARRSSLNHNFLLNLSYNYGNFDPSIGIKRYENLVTNDNVYYNFDNSFNSFTCKLEQTDVELTFVHAHDALKLIKETG